MSNINAARPSFFPKTTESTLKPSKSGAPFALKRNEASRIDQLDKLTSKDAKVDIPEGIKDFSKIKSAVVQAQEPSRDDYLKSLKEKIQNGSYKVDYDAVAEKMLETEF